MPDQEKEATLVLVNQVSELEKMALFLDELSEKWDLPMPLTMSLNLALEEAFTNIIQYGFSDDGEHQIDIGFMLNKGSLQIIIQDDGIAYDPTSKADPDTGLSVEEREIGGLGIFLIKQIMDHVEYKRIDGMNILTLKKTI